MKNENKHGKFDAKMEILDFTALKMFESIRQYATAINIARNPIEFLLF